MHVNNCLLIDNSTKNAPRDIDTYGTPSRDDIIRDVARQQNRSVMQRQKQNNYQLSKL